MRVDLQRDDALLETSARALQEELLAGHVDLDHVARSGGGEENRVVGRDGEVGEDALLFAERALRRPNLAIVGVELPDAQMLHATRHERRKVRPTECSFGKEKRIF